MTKTDPAKGGYYTVEKLNQPGIFRLRKAWKWKIRGFAADGELLLETVHTNDVSKNMECAVWKARGAEERKL